MVIIRHPPEGSQPPSSGRQARSLAVGERVTGTMVPFRRHRGGGSTMSEATNGGWADRDSYLVSTEWLA